MGIRLSGWGYFFRRMFVPFLLRSADQRPVLEAGELQRQLSGWQGGQGSVPGASDARRRVPAEQTWAVRHAWQRVAMARLGPCAPGRRLVQRGLLLPGGVPQQGRAGGPAPLHRVPTCPSRSEERRVGKEGRT